ncbi:MAG: CHAT domain-containing protein [Deltaproteobacteria bacterium]|nr:CHAT domain-containing protein [Deltaproteobacteria bacterium]
MARVTLSSTTIGWKLVSARVEAGGRGRRAAASASPDLFARQLASTGRVEVVEEGDAQSAPRRGVAPSSLVGMSVEAPAGQRYVMMARHPSGAITFHLPVETERRGDGRGPSVLLFHVPAASAAAAAGRRGLLGGVVRWILLKVADVVAHTALPVLAAAVESALWKKRRLTQGWVNVPATGGWPIPFQALPPGFAFAAPPKRNLLLVHGILSNAEAAFPGLATTVGSGGKTLFQALEPLYEGRVFAFNHFTVSKSPEENARALLESLPAGPTTFDVITHSRGGIVFRHMTERPDIFGSLAGRFRLGRAVLVASPNEGSPLASAGRLEGFLGWVANLLELFPDSNPFTTGLEIVSEGLAWLAAHIAEDLPGVAGLDPSGPQIKRIQAPPDPPPGALSALVANFEPDEGLLRRMSDAAVDAYFATANDLVVPSEGGWRVGEGLNVSDRQIGCFGPGGNLPSSAKTGVHHVNFFFQAATIDFLVRALRGEAQPLPVIDPTWSLPYRSSRRGGPGAGPSVRATTPLTALPILPPPPSAPPALPGAPESLPTPPMAGAAMPTSAETFGLTVLGGPSAAEDLRFIASFRNAMVLETVPRRGGDAGRRWHDIIQTQREIRAFISGETNAPDLPQGQKLVKLGSLLFAALLPGEVRRLYDVARASQQSGRLNVVFTSMVDWIADLPWEFAYDVSRRSFLAVEEVNFVRNVETAIPADRIPPRACPLRILVVVAQPLGTAHLSFEEETEVIRSGFRRLLDAGIAEVEILSHATPDALHRAVEAAIKPFDVLHFIGHGTFQAGASGQPGTGALVFEDDQGQTQHLDAPTLRQIVARRGIRLVFLNSCESGRGGIADFNRGVAPALLAAGVPSVVANQFSVLDTAATAFARHFYWSLAIGTPIGDAAREARVAVNASIPDEALDWAIPVVFAQNPCDRLVERQPAVASAVTPVGVPGPRRGAARRKERVALWDVHRVFPGLDQIAQTMVSAQSYFDFQAVSFSAPLGTWRREKSEGTAYLWAEKVAARLQGRKAELGVDRLHCITSLPLRDDTTFDLYAWDDGVVSIFSTADLLEQLEPPQLSVQRMLANVVIGILTSLPEHHRGPKNCPLYYNDERDIRCIAGPLRLCAADRAKLKSDPERLKAVEALLEVYG